MRETKKWRCLGKRANLMCVLFQKSSAFRLNFFLSLSVKYFDIFVVKVCRPNLKRHLNDEKTKEQTIDD